MQIPTAMPILDDEAVQGQRSSISGMPKKSEASMFRPSKLQLKKKRDSLRH